MSIKFVDAVAVPAAYAAATAPNVDASGFTPDFWVLRATAGSFIFSFDGSEDHGRVQSTDLYPLILWNRGKKLWVKQAGGASTASLGAYTRT